MSFSGIRADATLLTTYRDLKPGSTIKASITEIEGVESVTVDCVSTDFEQLKESLNDACYLIHKTSLEEKQEIVFFTFVPQDSKVKQKMMYGSTKTGLVKELGAVSYSVFATTIVNLVL